MTRHGAPADYAMRIALSHLGLMRIELIEQKRGDTIYADFIRTHGYASSTSASWWITWRAIRE